MRYQEIHRLISNRTGYWLWLSWLLQPFVLLYITVTTLNRFLYTKSFRKKYKLNSIIVSIGNIEVGGVGKTPVTIRVATKLAEMGLSVSVVCKNLCASGGAPIAVRPGSTSGSVSLSDEAILLGNLLSKTCSVYTGSDKTDAVRRAVREMKPDVVVVDDAFQHHKLHRDIDVIVLNADHPFGTGGVLPAGTLRESSRALSKADYLWVNGVTSDSQLALAKKLISAKNWKAPFIASSVIPGKPQKFDGTFDKIDKVVAFCGIGKPEGFKHTLEKTGFTIEKFYIYPDHWFYTQSDLDHIERSFKKSSAKYLITTEKDAARLGSRKIKALNIRVLPIKLFVPTTSTEEELLGNILELVEAKK